MDKNYIQDHINRIETRFKDNPQMQDDSLWRIASNANLIDGLNCTLSPEEKQRVEQFIEQFKRGE
ncbi:MAG: hypothetical protein ACOVOV_01300 [Dolichospermum sp.]